MRAMKWMVAVGLLAGNLLGQLTPAQREQDFLTLANVFAKRYGPANWKIEALGVNLFHVSPWLQRVRTARTDIEFLEICAQYVSSLQDGHAQFIGPGNFEADLGFTVDLYDGKVLIDGINTRQVPPSRFPLAIGDELVEIDGRPVGEVVQEFARLHTYANPRYTLRVAADALVYRTQASIPSAGLLGDTARIKIRRADGTEREYVLPWTKFGTPLTRLGSLPGLFGTGAGASSKTAGRAVAAWDPESDVPLWKQVQRQMKQWRMTRETDPLLRGRVVDEVSGEERPGAMHWDTEIPGRCGICRPVSRSGRGDSGRTFSSRALTWRRANELAICASALSML